MHPLVQWLLIKELRKQGSTLKVVAIKKELEIPSAIGLIPEKGEIIDYLKLSNSIL